MFFSLSVTYESGEEGTIGDTSEMGTCTLDDNERITDVIAYINVFGDWPPIITGLALNTTMQTCGLFETTSADMEQASGQWEERRSIRWTQTALWLWLYSQLKWCFLYSRIKHRYTSIEWNLDMP